MPASVSDIAASAAIRHPMPAVMYQLLSVNESLPGAMAALPTIIRLDPDLERRLANVAQGDGPWRDRTSRRSLELGLAEIGFRRVHSTALLIVAMKSLPHRSGPLDVGGFWRYSTAVAFIATSLAYAREAEDRAYAFAAGVFHDVGRLILAGEDPAGLARVEAAQALEADARDDAERAALGYAAVDLSAALIHAWRLPQPLASAVDGLAGHDPTGLAGVLREAAVAARALGFGLVPGPDGPPTTAATDLIDRYYEGVEGLRRRIRALLESAAAPSP